MPPPPTDISTIVAPGVAAAPPGTLQLQASLNGGPFSAGTPPGGGQYGIAVHPNDVVQFKLIGTGASAVGNLTVTGAGGATGSIPFAAGQTQTFNIPAGATSGQQWLISYVNAGFVTNSILLTVQ